MKVLEFVLIFSSFVAAAIAFILALFGKHKVEYVYWLVTLSATLLVLSRLTHKFLTKNTEAK